MRIALRQTTLAIVPAAVISLAWAASALAQVPDMDAPIEPDPAVITGRLDNGLTYFVHANDQPRNRAELRLVVNAGSILEDEDQLGLAHFVEHMAFNGTRNFEKQELVDYLESIGMQFGPDVNAYTSFDETVYMLQVPVDDPEIVATAFQILEDWAGAVLFEAEEVDKERGVVIEEWRGGRGAFARMRDKQYPVMFEGSLYADRLPIGKPEVLESASADLLRRYYDDWYRPDLMAVVAVGDFDGEAIVAMVQRHFGGIEPPADPRPRVEARVPIDHPARIAIASDVEAGQSQVSVLYKQPPGPRGTVGEYRQSLVRGVYAGMLNGRLDELRLQADPPFLFGFSGTGGFVRGVDAYQLGALVPEGGIERGLDALLTEAERVVRHGFTETELGRRKVAIRRANQRSLAEKDNRESASLASRYVRAFLEGDPYPSVEDRVSLSEALLPGITQEEANAVAQAWLTERGRVVLVDSPEKEGLEIPTEDQLAGVFAGIAGKDLAPYEDAVADAPLLAVMPEGSPVLAEETLDEAGITIWTLANDVRVVLKPTDFKDDEIRFSAVSPGGTSLISDEVYPLVYWAGSVVGQSGVGDFDETALRKKLTGQAVSVTPTIGALTEGFRGSASPRDIETAFQLIHQYFHAPRLDEGAFSAYRTLQVGFFGNAGASPDFAFSDTISVTMGQGHPRSRSMSQRMADLERADLDAAFELYRDRFADASDFTFYFVGALDLEEMRSLAERYLGALPDLDRVEDWRDLGIDPPVGVTDKVVRKGLEPKSRTQIIFTGDGEYSREEWMTISALADVLDIRLRELLREDLGGTYGVRVSGGLTYRPDEEYRISIGFGSAPERAEELSAVVFEEIERIKAGGPDEETVSKVRETQRRAKETDLRENGYWLTQLSSFESQGLDLNRIPRYDWIESWTAEQVRQAAIRYLRGDRYAKFVLLPEGEVP